jgi:conjugative transfer region protein TrbK
MNTKRIGRIPRLAAVVLVVLVVAAGEIRLRDEEGNTETSATADVISDPLATQLAECRSVTYEQKDALSECRKVWTEKRRQFLGRKSPAPSESGALPADSSSIAAPKDQSRLQSGDPPIQQTGKE